jgi:hypothetical protein
MAKPKKHSAKTTKGSIKANKYSKLMLAASKELAAKKKALVKAEKALARGTKTHQELLGEVARLDMVERSLKALVEGTEPPQNVRYVYTYPQWVWSYPQWCYTTTYPYNGTYTITLGNAQTYNSVPNLQGGNVWSGYYQNASLNATPSVNLTTGGTNTISATSGAYSTVNTGISTVTTDTVPCTLTATNSGSSLVGDIGMTLSSTVANWANAGTTDLTVDLSTGATEDDTAVNEPEATVVGHGG